MKVEEKNVKMYEITLTPDEAHEVTMALDDHINFVDKKRGEKVAPVILNLFAYFDKRML